MPTETPTEPMPELPSDPMSVLRQTRPISRRRWLGGVGAAGAALAAGGAGLLAPSPAEAQAAGSPQLDVAVLQFALQLEYLEAEFYLRAIGKGSAPGGGNARVTGGRRVDFQTSAIRQYANEIAADEANHVRFLQRTLGSRSTPRPEINFTDAFRAAAAAAGLGNNFDAFANETNFLLGAFIFEDVGVTAYRGAAPLVSRSVVGPAASILAVEAYHAASVRTVLFGKGRAAINATNQISKARDSLDGGSDLDQGLTVGNVANLVPTDSNSLTFARTTSQVLNIVFLKPGKGVSRGGFFPRGINGTIRST